MLVMFFFLSPASLRRPSTDRPETLPHDRKLVRLNKFSAKIRGALPPKKWGAKNMQNFGQFSTTSDFDREYLRNGARYRKSERHVISSDSFRVRCSGVTTGGQRGAVAPGRSMRGGAKLGGAKVGFMQFVE